MTISRHDCQERYDRIKVLLDAICDEIASIEHDWLLSNASEMPGRLATLWDLKTRYSLEKIHMESEFKNILKGIEND